MRDGAVLDIGCNAGYTSIHLAAKYGLRPVGIDVQARHIETAQFLADVAGIEAEFLLEHADSFVRPAAFDVVAHFGTLYHLQNPLRSLQSTYENLRPGGYLALDGRPNMFRVGLLARKGEKERDLGSAWPPWART